MSQYWIIRVNISDDMEPWVYAFDSDGEWAEAQLLLDACPNTPYTAESVEFAKAKDIHQLIKDLELDYVDRE